MRKTKERIISGIMSIILVLSNVLPISTTVINADEYFNTVDPKIEYSDSGTVPEKVITNTDFDNFSISMQYGYITEDLGDTLLLTDAETQVPITINIEYRGNQTYEAGEISFTMEDIKMLIRDRSSRSANNMKLHITYDIGAELVGSGSGRGDWYYTVSNENVLTEYSTYTFTNKNKTTGAFTSSVEILFGLETAKDFISGYEKTLSSTLTVGEYSKNTNDLYFKYSTTPDTYDVREIIPSQYTYKAYTEDDSNYTLNGYKLSEYYVMTANVFTDMYYNNRGFAESSYMQGIDPESYASVSFEADSGIIIYTNSDYYDPYEVLYNTDSKKGGKVYEYDHDFYPDPESDVCVEGGYNLLLFIPKAQYNIGDTFNLTATLSGVYLDEHEEFNDSLTVPVEIKDVIINVIPGELTGYKRMYDEYVSLYTIQKNNGIEIYSDLGTFYNPYTADDTADPQKSEITKTIIEDNFQSFCESIYKDDALEGTKAKINEYYVTRAEFRNIPSNEDSTVKIYIKPDSSTEYELFGTYNIAAEKDLGTMTINFNRTDIQDVKFEIDGDFASGESYDETTSFIRLYAHFNPEKNYATKLGYDFMFFNFAEIEQHVADGRTFYGTFWDYITVENSEVKVNCIPSLANYTVENNSLGYSLVLDGDINVYGVKDTDKSLEVNKITLSVEYPSVFTVDPENFKMGLTGNQKYVFKNSDFTTSNNKSFTKEELPDFLNITYTIESISDQTNRLTYIIETDSEHPFLTTFIESGPLRSSIADIGIITKISMDFDTYVGLKTQGKLPSTLEIVGTCSVNKTDTNFSDFNWYNTYRTSIRTQTLPTVAGSTYEGVEKFVNVGLGFIKNRSVVDPDGNYSYKIRLAGGETKVDNIILYDNLEEAYGENKYWKGTFNGIDTSLLDAYYSGENYTYTIYYSSDKNQAFDLSASGWVKSTDWTGTLSDVKSIAVDLGNFVLLPQSVAYVIINMKAPASSEFGAVAYNSYAADYKAYDATTGVLMEDIKALESNITEVVLNTTIDITVNKVWSGANAASDSITIKLLADEKEFKTTTLNTEDNWTYIFNDLAAFNSDGAMIVYSIEEISQINGFETTYNSSTDINGNIVFTITNTKLPDYVYNFEKEWKVEEGKEDIVLGLVEDSDLSLEEQKIARANKTFTITASGEELETITFEANSNNKGSIIIPAEYANYTNFNFNFEYNNETYICNYEISYSEPVIPDTVTLNASNGNTITLNKENNWKASYSFENSGVTFKENIVENWYDPTTGLAITFDEKFMTESPTYDYLIIYYVLDGQVYQFGKYGGLSSNEANIAGQTINVPSKDIYFYWKTDSNVSDYYGFKVTNIQEIKMDIPENITTTTLPNLTATELSGISYPESAHTPYGDSIKQLWHYTGSSNNNITITQIDEYNYDVKVLNTSKAIANIVSSNMTVKEYIFNFEKIWSTETKDSIVLGLFENDKLTLEEQKIARANKTVQIEALGEGLENKIFEVTADENGNFIIPTEYKDYTNFTFKIASNIFTYNVSKSNPVKPDSIILDDSKGNTVTLSKENDWKSTIKYTDPTITFTERIPDGWYSKELTNGLAVTFDNNFKTEAVNWDYLEIYYKIDENIYKFGKYGGTDLAGQTINVPSKDIYFYWVTDTSNDNYYGFKVINIKPISVEVASQSKSTLPNLTATELSGTNYPESAHTPYGNSIKQLWHYTGTSVPANISINQNNDIYSVLINNTGVITYNISGNIDTEYTYTFNKTFQADLSVDVVGYDNAYTDTLSKAEYVSLITDPNTTITVTDTTNNIVFSGNGKADLENALYSYSVNGGTYKFTTTLETFDKIYVFTQSKRYYLPDTPESITINASNGESIILNSENNWTTTWTTTDADLTFTEVITSPWSNLNTEVISNENGTYTVNIINTTGYKCDTSYTHSSTDKITNITIIKEWILNKDFIKLNIKDSLGYEGNYEKVEILNKAGTVLETIVKPDEAGLLVSANKYFTNETYIAKVYMIDGTVKTATINKTPFKLVPVEIEIFDGETSLGVFELNENNSWQVTVSVPPNTETTVQEITTGNWTYKVNDNVITNTVLHEIEITDITVPADGEIIDTGNNGIPLFIYPLFLIGIIGLSTSLKYKKKYKY